MKKALTVFLIIIIAGAGYYLWQTRLATKSIKLYFATKDGMALQAESWPLTGDKIRAALEGLIAGPKDSNHLPTIPKQVTLLSYRVQNDLCTVNFNQNMITNHWGGSSGELLTVYSIVDTLTQFPEIKQVQILIEGRKVETLTGHLMLNESIGPDLSLIKK